MTIFKNISYSMRALRPFGWERAVPSMSDPGRLTSYLQRKRLGVYLTLHKKLTQDGSKT